MRSETRYNGVTVLGHHVMMVVTPAITPSTISEPTIVLNAFGRHHSPQRKPPKRVAEAPVYKRNLSGGKGVQPRGIRGDGGILVHSLYPGHVKHMYCTSTSGCAQWLQHRDFGTAGGAASAAVPGGVPRVEADWEPRPCAAPGPLPAGVGPPLLLAGVLLPESRALTFWCRCCSNLVMFAISGDIVMRFELKLMNRFGLRWSRSCTGGAHWEDRGHTWDGSTPGAAYRWRLEPHSAAFHFAVCAPPVACCRPLMLSPNTLVAVHALHW